MEIEEIKRQGGSWIRIEKIVRNISLITEDIVKYYNKKPIEYDYQRVLFEFIQRIHINYFVINSSLNTYLMIPKFRFSIYTLLRPLLSDFIIQIYLIETLALDNDTLKPNQMDFMEKYAELSNQFYHRINSLLEGQIKDTIISAADRNEYFYQESLDYPEHFDSKGRVKKLTKNQLQPKNIVDEIKKGEFKDLANVYNQYFILSQFDHFSEKTEALMKVSIEMDYQMISECSDYILRGLILNLSLMDKATPFIDKLLAIKDEIFE